MLDDPKGPSPADAAQNERAVAGHNGPPSLTYDPAVFEDMATRTARFMAANKQWLDLQKIENETHAKELNDFVAGARKAKKIVDDARAEAKKPYKEAGDAIQAAFTPLIEKLDRAIRAVQPLLTAWATKLAEEKAAEVERQRAAAAEKAAEAERLAAAAAGSNDVAAQVDAEAAAKEAAKAAKLADRTEKETVKVGSATGGGRTAALREYRSARITNLRKLFFHYMERPEVADCLLQLANADIRAKGVDGTAIPGIEIVTERKMV